MRPKYALKDLPPSPQDKRDERIESGGPYWDLRTIQTALQDGALDWFLTSAAEEDLRNELRFDDDEFDTFLQLLHQVHCRRRASQWCLEPRSPSSSAADNRIQRLSDAYVMGFNRITGREQSTAFPGVYVKFSVSADPSLLIIYSAHYERHPGK